MSQPPSQGPDQGPWNGGRPPMVPPPPPDFGPPEDPQDPGEPSGPPPREPRGPGRASPWLWIGLGCGGLFVLGVVLVVLVAFVLDDRGQDRDTSESEGTGTSSTAPRMNDTIEHDGILFTVTGTEVTDEIGGHSPLGEYLVVRIDVANAGVDEFWRDEQHVYTSSGERIEEDYGATLKLKSPIWQDLPVDGTPVGVGIAFDVESASDISHVGLSSRFRGGNELRVELGN